MTAAYFWPFWSSVIFFEAGVLPLKNVSQLVLISETAAPLPGLVALADVGGADGLAGAGELAGADGDELAAGLLADELEPLLQAATVAVSASPIAGIIIRPTKRLNRMTRLRIPVG